MEYRRLGTSDVKVSEMSLGCWTMGGLSFINGKPNGWANVDEDEITEAVKKVFSFKPADIVKQLKLLRPIYSDTTNYGHFGKVDDTKTITWERTDKAAALKRAIKA